MMPSTISNSDTNITLSYKYQKDEEFVFCSRAQPFVVLVPGGDLHIPTSTLIDFSLVRDLKLKISDMKCQKFSYGGFNMRIVGQVTTHVQCIKEGFPVGKIHFTASVVRGLSTNLDTDSVAGTRLAKLLSRQDIPETVCDTVEKKECKDVSKLSRQLPGDDKLPLQLPPAPNVLPTAPGPGLVCSPPSSGGLPSSPLSTGGCLTSPGGRDDVRRDGLGGRDDARHDGLGGRDDVHHEGAGGLDDVRHEGAGGLDDTVPSLCASVRSVAVAENLSLHDANVKVLNLTFGRADLQPDPDLMMDTLLANSVKTKVKGQIFREPGRQFRYVRDDKLVFSSNHGRNRCSRRKCSSLADVPHNCLLHPQWPLPNGFKFCGHNCQGAFCYCLKYS